MTQTPMMESLLRDWDGESVVVRYDAAAQAWLFIAIHDRSLGPAVGGCRMLVYRTPTEGLRDALRLGAAMTQKWAACGFPFGGGKAVIAQSRPLDAGERRDLLLRFGALVESLGGSYRTAEDMGTSAADMDVLAERTRHVFGRTPSNGGSGDPGPFTALGVFTGIVAACEAVYGTGELGGRTVLVQGVGHVGAPLARRLKAAGARVLVTDALPGRAQALADEIGVEVIAPHVVYDTACDVYAPCAIGGILNSRSIPRLRCRIVAGAANNQLDEEADARRLHDRGILYVPDFVLNAGGAIGNSSMEVHEATREAAEARVRAIGEAVREILADAERRDDLPLNEANRRATRVLEHARARRDA